MIGGVGVCVIGGVGVCIIELWGENIIILEEVMLLRNSNDSVPSVHKQHNPVHVLTLICTQYPQPPPPPPVHTDPSQVDILDINLDHNAFAGALKLYLRELPNPVFTYQLYELFVSAGSECQPPLL